MQVNADSGRAVGGSVGPACACGASTNCGAGCACGCFGGGCIACSPPTRRELADVAQSTRAHAYAVRLRSRFRARSAAAVAGRSREASAGGRFGSYDAWSNLTAREWMAIPNLAEAALTSPQGGRAGELSHLDTRQGRGGARSVGALLPRSSGAPALGRRGHRHDHLAAARHGRSGYRRRGSPARREWRRGAPR